jgi:hypothetical protein
MGFLKALATSSRFVTWFRVIAVGTAAVREFAFGVDPTTPSVVGIV